MNNLHTFSDPHMAELADVLHFTAKDLEYNRQGTLTKSQVERLKNALLQQIKVLAVILVASVIMGTIGLWDIIEQPVIVWVVLAITALLAIGVLFHRLNRLTNGLAVRTSKLPNKPPSYRSTIDTPEGDRLHMPFQLNRILLPNQSYTVYYVPMRVNRYSYYIVSMEPIGELV